MPKVCLTPETKAKRKQEMLIAFCDRKRKELGISWDRVAAELEKPRSTVQHRFDNGLFEAWEWLMLFHILKIGADELEGVFKL